jgi:O-antigen/teichoic acid export membrane protein
MLQATNQTRVLFVTSISILITNLVLSPPLTMAFGFVGPAIATALSYVPAWLFTLHRIGCALGGGIADAMPWRHYAHTLVVAGGLGGVLWLVRPALDFHPGANLAIAIGGYAIAYLAIGRLTGVLGAADTAYLRRVVTLGTWR